jgi:hypothetical protein
MGASAVTTDAGLWDNRAMTTRFGWGAVALVIGLFGCGSDDDSKGGGSGGSGNATSGGSGGSGNASSGGSGNASSGGSGNASTGGAPSGGSGGGSAGGLAAQYPGDVGMENDPAVVWMENFEEASVGDLVNRYEDAKSNGITLDADVSAASSGTKSGKFTASVADSAADLFKKLPSGNNELFIRYYAKYQSGIQWHHTGVWVGGYNPASNYPSPQAGLKPNGDDRFSVSIEPIEPGPNPRLDTYNYWMQMHSWMDQPSGNTAYYGNSVIHEPTFEVEDDAWMCIEIHIKLNPDPSTSAGAELGVWKNNTLIAAFTDSTPMGYWIKDKFCPENSVGTECTDYKPSNPTLVPLDLQYRSVAGLDLNAFWPQNYITEGPEGSVWYDDMVLATTRVGCIE